MNKIMKRVVPNVVFLTMLFQVSDHVVGFQACPDRSTNTRIASSNQ